MGVEGFGEIYIMGLKADHWIIELNIYIFQFPLAKIVRNFSYINEIYLKVSRKKLALAMVHFVCCLN